MRRSNWVKNKKTEHVHIGQRWELSGKSLYIPIIDIVEIEGSVCKVVNTINHSHYGHYFKSEILSYYKLVEKKPIPRANGKIRQIDLTQS